MCIYTLMSLKMTPFGEIWNVQVKEIDLLYLALTISQYIKKHLLYFKLKF